jgi:probable HAF family extracellular repeat protein
MHHAFITGPNGVGMTDLGPLGFNFSTAYGINNVGQVVGYSATPNGYHAFITGSNGVA